MGDEPGIDLDMVGRRGRTTRFAWTSNDAALYALGIGAGRDPLDLLELPYATGERAYPMMVMAVGVAGADRPSFGSYDRSRFVHGSQTLDLHAPLPAAGEIALDCEITGLADKGSGALITWTTTAALNGSPLFTSAASGFLIGAGGFGARDPRPPEGRSAWRSPVGEPDRITPMPTRPEQALIYRLSGDRNPLHSDPATAQRGGFTRPILQGLCVLGSAARAVLGSAAESLTHLEARFAAPVLPGDDLAVQTWEEDAGTALFRVVRTDGALVLDRGVVCFTDAARTG